MKFFSDPKLATNGHEGKAITVYPKKNGDKFARLLAKFGYNSEGIGPGSEIKEERSVGHTGLMYVKEKAQIY